MTKLKINRLFAYIFIVLSFLKVVFSLIFMHTSDLGENIFHYFENLVHIILLVLLCRQAIKNHIAHFFHEYFLEAIIMGVISSISLVYTCIIHDYSFNENIFELVTATISLIVNIYLLVSFHHHHDKTVKTVLIVFVGLSLLLGINLIIGNIVSFVNLEINIELFITSLISNLLTIFFNIFVLLTAISMKHVLRKDPSKIVDYVKLEDDE